jgi:hypothetical protein
LPNVIGNQLLDPILKTFIIAESNDSRYDTAFVITLLLTIAIPVVGVAAGLINHFPLLAFPLIGLPVLSTYLIRYFFKDHNVVGQLTFHDTEVVIRQKDQVISIKNVSSITLRYDGYFGATTLQGIPSKDGAKNELSIVSDSNIEYKLSIYLSDADEKDRLVDRIKRFSKRTNSRLDLGNLVSI